MNCMFLLLIDEQMIKIFGHALDIINEIHWCDKKPSCR